MKTQEFIAKWEKWFSYSGREDLRKEMEADLDDMSAPKWFSILEVLPQYDIPVAVLGKSRQVDGEILYQVCKLRSKTESSDGIELYWATVEDVCEFEPTHWMPLSSLLPNCYLRLHTNE